MHARIGRSGERGVVGPVSSRSHIEQTRPGQLTGGPEANVEANTIRIVPAAEDPVLLEVLTDAPARAPAPAAAPAAPAAARPAPARVAGAAPPRATAPVKKSRMRVEDEDGNPILDDNDPDDIADEANEIADDTADDIEDDDEADII